MENNFNIDDPFEQFLQDKVKDQKMYPSEQIWENIRTSIHGDRSWPALTFIALFIITALTIATVLNYPPKTIATKTSNIYGKTVDRSNQSSIEAEKDSNDKETLQEQINPGNYTSKTLAYINNNAADITVIKPTINPNIISPAIAINESNKLVNTKLVLKPVTTNKIIAQSANTDILSIDSSDIINDKPSGNTAATNKPYSSRKRKLNRNIFQSGINNNDEDPTVENYFNDFAYQPNHKKRTKSKFELQFYVTPSISYRKLEDDKIRMLYAATPAATSTTNNVPIAQTQVNVNTIVRHTPALGMEVGAGLLYTLSPNVKLKTGIQFNVRQYYIDASQSFNIATIAIVQNNRLDSVKVFSPFSNSTGFNNTKIDNKLYQLSIPLGLQWDFVNGKRLGVSLGASIEPTITLNKNVYMISTDYKYYANGASFFRKWNFNTSVDLNITYRTGDLKWYLGPQIRYQHLPTYTDIYPIKEYRWDYGLKIGVLIPIYK